MRTTLKRGIGQAAGSSGNGHSVVPPLFGPVARYKQPDGPRRSVLGWILRIFGWLVLALAVVGAGIAGGAYLYGHESLAQVVNVTPKVKHADINLTQLPSPNSPAVALVAGYDVRAKSTGKDPYAGSNSDTLMLLRADPQNGTLSLLSFPRDLYVHIYCHGDTYQTTSRINSAWSYCSNGPAGTLDTIEHLAPSLKINYLITLDFHAFKQLVNQLHGVYMNVDRRYYNPHGTGYSAINLQPGYQKLTGGAALSYVRFRHTDSDIYRTGRQQLFIEALKSRLRSALSLTSLPLEVPKLIHVLKSNIEVGTAGGSSVDLGLLGKYLNLIYGLPAGHLLRNQIPLNDFTYPTIGGASVTTAPQSAINQAVNSFLHPDVRESSAVGAQYGAKTSTPKKKAKVHKLAKQDISVLVLNAGTVPGEASDTSYRLETHGYTTKTLPSGDQANAPKVQSYSTVYYDSVQPNAQQAAQQIAPLFGKQTKVVPMTTAISSFAQQAGNPMTVVTVGTQYPGHLVIVKPPKVQPKQPAQVSNGAAMTAPALRHVYDKVHFPLMVPNKIAQGFVLNSDEGVRGFKPIGHQHEVVLSFGQPYGLEYFQVEETTWNSAPLFANPSFTLVHKGQKFLVYTTGGQIQMVALRTPRATYWVSNTILNELSNSTMIAIAESLRPLRR
jgi:LCP family protein required for cell wall assembly